MSQLKRYTRTPHGAVVEHENGDICSWAEVDARIAELEAELAERTAAVIVHGGQALACSEAVANAYGAAKAERDAALSQVAGWQTLSGNDSRELRRLCQERDDLRKERDAARADASSALMLLARMRQACGDNGARMQDELEEYLHSLLADAERYRCLRKGRLKGITITSYDQSLCFEGDELDAEVDAARGGGV